MKALIVCVSVSHGNTHRLALAVGEVLHAPVLEPEEVDVSRLSGCDVVGFASGIFWMGFHPRLTDFVRSLPPTRDQHAFVLTTSGGPELPWWPYTRRFAGLLEAKGFEVVDTFSCRGFDTWLPLRLIGGLNKGRPSATDLAAAREFAATIRGRLGPSPRTATIRRRPAAAEG